MLHFIFTKRAFPYLDEKKKMMKKKKSLKYIHKAHMMVQQKGLSDTNGNDGLRFLKSIGLCFRW